MCALHIRLAGRCSHPCHEEDTPMTIHMPLQHQVPVLPRRSRTHRAPASAFLRLFALLSAAVVTATPSLAADFPLYATTIPNVDDWTNESFALGAPGCGDNCPCNDGQYATIQANLNTLMTATDFQAFVLPPGEKIVDVRINTLVRFDQSESGTVRLLVDLPCYGIVDQLYQTPVPGQADGTCDYAFQDGGPSIFGLLTPAQWNAPGTPAINGTGGVCNGIAMSIRSVAGAASNTLRCKALRVRVFTAPCAGTPCDDGNPCTINDVLQADCQCAGTPMNCNDGNPCTIDTCVNGVCVHTPMNCNDGNPCTIDTCVNGVCVHTPMNCNDGNPCTIDTCVNGVCVHTPMNCNDGNPCTIDTCVNGNCVHIPVSCDDGDSCTGDFCVNGVCVHVPINCDDGNPLTVDTCVNGNCVHKPIICDDGNPCTIDTYDGQNCVHTLITTDSDGDGVPDCVDLCPGGDDSVDCDGNGLPDFCQLNDVHSSSVQSPFGAGWPLQATFAGLSLVSKPISFQVLVASDLDTTTEFVTVKMNGSVIGTLFGANSGSDCPTKPDVGVITIQPQIFNQAIVVGSGTVQFVVEASGAVSATQCASSTAQANLIIPLDFPDCDANGTWDACDIASGKAVDKNGDGVPDKCNYAVGDFDLDGCVAGSDLALLLSAWGSSDPIIDLTDDGLVNAQDLATLLANWGCGTR